MPVSELVTSDPPLPREATEIPERQWYLKIALINFVAWFVFLALLVLLLEVSLPNSISPILDHP
jgi:hypothetical protein